MISARKLGRACSQAHAELGDVNDPESREKFDVLKENTTTNNTSVLYPNWL